MKRILSLGLILLFLLCGCKKAENSTKPKAAEKGKIQVVTTIFPPYDFLRELAGDSAEITMLLPPGSESHNYEPSLSDLSAISKCDVFVYVGGEIDPWAETALAGSYNKGRRAIKLLDLVDTKHTHGGETQTDEHIWTSPRLVMEIVKKLADTLAEVDPENSAVYNGNKTDYIDKLVKLHGDFQRVAESGRNKTLVFADRFPFHHFCESYSLECVSALPGCSSDTEPTLTAVKNLIESVKKNKIPAVLYTETADGEIAKRVMDATGCSKRLFHSCHSLTSDELENGESYISLMEQNLKVLEEVLS